MRVFFLVIVTVALLSSCNSAQKSTKSEKFEKLPKRDFLVLKADTGVIKMPEQFNVESRNQLVNISAFLENRYLFQINGLPYEETQNDSAKFNSQNINVVIVRPPLKPCVCLDKSKNNFAIKKNPKQRVLYFYGEIVCDGMLFEFTGAYTGEIPAPTEIISE